ncbi:MAG: ABC transporter C-terminal domain-containing protein [Synergistota bacterium]|nr:ABC transporter C-terminal domain-containing protein [Synergistota bacterium]
MRYMICCMMILLLSIFSAGLAFAGEQDDCAELEARIEELSQEIDDSTDISELAALQSELAELTNEYMERCVGGEGGVPSLPSQLTLFPSSPASTPEKEIERQRAIINTQRQQIEQSLAFMESDGEEQLVPVPRAIPIRGSVFIDGGFKSKPYRGWVRQEITYEVRESFVGNLIIKEFFSTRTGEYTGDVDYSISTLSTGIGVLQFGGRECVKASAGLPGHCEKWEYYDLYEIDKSEVYPGFYAEVVFLETEEDGVILRTKSPKVIFKSINGEAVAQLGCFGAEKAYSADLCKSLIDGGRIQFTEQVGSDSQATPGCRVGSIISMEMDIESF